VIKLTDDNRDNCEILIRRLNTAITEKEHLLDRYRLMISNARHTYIISDATQEEIGKLFDKEDKLLEDIKSVLDKVKKECRT